MIVHECNACGNVQQQATLTITREDGHGGDGVISDSRSQPYHLCRNCAKAISATLQQIIAANRAPKP